MNITFLIGNGFDRNLGLKTTYSDFVEEYKKTDAKTQTLKDFRQYINANEKTILNEQHSLKNYDITIQITNMLGASISSGIGSAVYIAIVSALYKKNLKSGLAVLGNISVGGAVERASPCHLCRQIHL